jgi:hypothetical protein
MKPLAAIAVLVLTACHGSSSTSPPVTPIGADVACTTLFRPGRPVADVIAETPGGLAVCVDRVRGKIVTSVEAWPCNGGNVWVSDYGWGKSAGLWTAGVYGADPACA